MDFYIQNAALFLWIRKIYPHLPLSRTKVNR